MSTKNASKPKQAVSYIRVSTARQGHSGLGLEAQQNSVRIFSQANGLEIAKEFIEIESGKNDSRPILQEALTYSKKIGGTLVIAKLDRLARSVSFISQLMDAKTDFRACDYPDVPPMVLHIMAAVSENEAKACSDRTKAALAAAKERGVLLGAANPKCQNLPDGAYARGGQVTKARALEAYADVRAEIFSMKINHGLSYQEIANTLNARGRFTRHGKEWHPMQVSRVLNRAPASA
jgi:DNA invertase Pin-like site-specific DNA recombinase